MRWGRSIHDLGTIRLSWLELEAVIEHAPPGSAIRGLSDPISPYKTPEGQLIAAAVDTLAGANWQRSGGKGPKPRPLMERIKKEMDRARQDAAAPKDLQGMQDIRAELEARRKSAVDSGGKKEVRLNKRG